MRKEKGFTLIELLVVIGTIGVLAALAMSGFSVYRASAAYAVVERTISSARTAAEAGISDADNLPSAVSLTSINSQGPIGGVAGDYLVGMQIPGNVKLDVEYDPTCTTAVCQSELIQVNHCWANEYARWIRYGDGVDILLQNISGAGCS
ncbi:MAG: type II secretion system protein [Bdellovibrionales bacterium]|nr:type II secretion system protein [Bdellovibrionales bacterium]